MIKRIPYGKSLPDYKLIPPDAEPLIQCSGCKEYWYKDELDHREDEYGDWAYYCPKCDEELLWDLDQGVDYEAEEEAARKYYYGE